MAIICFAVLVCVGLFARPHPAEAQLGNVACNATINMSNAVPVYDQATQAQKNVTCTANGLVWQAAQLVLHLLTTSVVNWINSGFDGNPSFLSNPEGFFLDAADQATGVFIGASGPLASLCSPFSLDLRLSLALGVTANANQRYTCTLSKIIQTQQGNVQRLANGQVVNVSVNKTGNGATIGDFQNGNVLHNSNQLSVNGSSVASVGGFLSGDFSQGGLPGFLALTTEPQNNPFGASLRAQSDLQMQIMSKQNSINNDLNRGGGFLSWQKCTDVSVSGTSGTGIDYGDEGNAGKPKQTKKDCHTETPGSVISASLNKELGAQTDTLNLTNSINQIATALVDQLLTKVLSGSGGLLSSSQSASSGNNQATQSFINQYANDPALQTNFTNLKQQALAFIEQYATPLQQALTYRQQALAQIQTVSSSYDAARTCLFNKSQSNSASVSLTYIQSQLASLNSAISAKVTPQLNTYQSAVDLTQSSLTNVQNMQYQLQSASSVAELTSLNNDFTTSLISSSNPGDVQTAKAELDAATKTAKDLQTALTPYQTTCNGNTSSTIFQ